MSKREQIKFKTARVINLRDWDNLVMKVYGRVYSLQQQNGCYARGASLFFTVPDEMEEYRTNETVPEVVNGLKMGVSLAGWLKRDPKTQLSDKSDYPYLDMWWERNFYPELEAVTQDLYGKGHIPKGSYTIYISW